MKAHAARRLCLLFYSLTAQDGTWRTLGDISASIRCGIVHLHNKPACRLRANPREGITSFEFLAVNPNLDSTRLKRLLDWNFMSVLFNKITIGS